MANNTNNPQEAPLDKSLRKFKTHLSTYPNKQLAQLLRGYVVPILEELRFEYSDAFSYLEDRLDAGDVGEGTGDALEESKDTVLFLSSFLDTVLTTVGWIRENEISSEFPEDLKELFDEAKTRVVSLMHSIEEAQGELEDADDDDDDFGDEDNDEALSAAAPAETTEETDITEVVVAAETETVTNGTGENGVGA